MLGESAVFAFLRMLVRLFSRTNITIASFVSQPVFRKSWSMVSLNPSTPDQNLHLHRTNGGDRAFLEMQRPA
jgi:hypothetical protein